MPQASLRTLLPVFFVSWALYVFCAAGYVDTFDAEPSVLTAISLVKHGTAKLHVDDFAFTHYQPLYANGFYSKMGLGAPFVYLLPTLTAIGLAKAFNLAPYERTLIDFLISMVSPLLTALIITMLYYLYRFIDGHDRKSALGLSACVGIASILLPYSKSCHREVLQTFCLIGAFLAMKRILARRGGVGNYWLAGSAIALGTITKLAMAVPLAPVGAGVLYFALRSPQRGRKLFALGLPLLLALFAWKGLFHENSLHWTMYGVDTVKFSGKNWQHDFWGGIGLQWISWQYGMLWYCPVILWPLYALLKKARSGNWNLVDGIIVLVVILNTAFYAKWLTPAGDESLGPRYAVMLVPLLFLGIGPQTLASLRPLGIAGLLALITVSTWIQIPNTAVKMQQYWILMSKSRNTLDEPQWVANQKIFFRKLRGEPEIYRLSDFGTWKKGWVDLSNKRTLQGMNFWWAHLHRSEAPGGGYPGSRPTYFLSQYPASPFGYTVASTFPSLPAAVLLD